jgi:hypothetical protein
MLRDLGTVLEELHDGMTGYAARARAPGRAVRIAQAEMSLPMDVRLVLRDGGCALLADVQRSRADAPWREDTPSRLRIVWTGAPAADEVTP